jgi:hypothetical protein
MDKTFKTGRKMTSITLIKEMQFLSLPETNLSKKNRKLKKR